MLLSVPVDGRVYRGQYQALEGAESHVSAINSGRTRLDAHAVVTAIPGDLVVGRSAVRVQWSPTVRVTGLVRAVPAVVYAVVLFVASVMDPPAGGLPPTGPLGLVGVDKWLHVVGYGALSLLLTYALGSRTGRRIALAVTVATAYGAGIEVVQSILPLRAFSLADILANAVGAGLVGLTLWVETRRRASETTRDASVPE